MQEKFLYVDISGLAKYLHDTYSLSTQQSKFIASILFDVEVTSDIKEADGQDLLKSWITTDGQRAQFGDSNTRKFIKFDINTPQIISACVLLFSIILEHDITFLNFTQLIAFFAPMIRTLKNFNLCVFVCILELAKDSDRNLEAVLSYSVEDVIQKLCDERGGVCIRLADGSSCCYRNKPDDICNIKRNVVIDSLNYLVRENFLSYVNDKYLLNGRWINGFFQF